MNIKIKKKISFLTSFLCAVLTSNGISMAMVKPTKKENKTFSKRTNLKKAFLEEIKDQQEATAHNSEASFHPNDTRLSLVNNGAPTIKNLMIRALNEVGRVMYIWGGGRNVPSGARLRIIDTVGESPRWLEFASEIDSKMKSGNYDYNFKNFCNVSKNSKGEEQLGVASSHIGKGLDCSGFMAWLLMNTLSSEDLTHESFVVRAKYMTELFTKRRLGEFTEFGKIDKVYPGDIISMNQGYDDDERLEDESHVYLALGQFNDGSIILIDMSPPTVRIRGTRDRNSSRDSNGKLTSMAIRTAEEYMRNYFPNTYASFPNCTCSSDDYRLDSKMHWDTTSDSRKISDPDRYQSFSPTQILNDLLGPIPKSDASSNLHTSTNISGKLSNKKSA